ncbi:MAG: heat-inducible transcriptional repressor HrcA [Gammaproteobacteria bacterium]|nr:heat-inducible transcriptional repressor HrcA [Gammaproteobacteria bacterium]MDH3412019.1 heat-inducible transcriptional repressor HrcA [Gammaproteobacteria bacterium]
MKSDLNERAQHLLKTLVERYIRDGQPVGSRALARESGLDLSPATVRNVMADLEEMGLLRSPHTSAGRIPTASGYRLFVDTLLTVEPLNMDQVKDLESHFAVMQSPSTLIETASSLLSSVTHLAGIVMLPRQEHARLRQVEYLSLSERQVLAILVVNDREVQNRIIHTERRYTASELERAANYINSLCAGKDLYTVRKTLLEEIKSAREQMNTMMMAAIEMADKAFDNRPPSDDFLVAGQTNLMEYGELSDVEKLRQLFEAFNRKRDILHLLDQSLKASGVQIFIGEESGYEVLDECSVVTSPYQSEGEIVGVVGVIGPTRMAYERVIPIVDLTARLLGAALNKQH